jgi:hypothetical protein
VQNYSCYGSKERGTEAPRLIFMVDLCTVSPQARRSMNHGYGKNSTARHTAPAEGVPTLASDRAVE